MTVILMLGAVMAIVLVVVMMLIFASILLETLEWVADTKDLLIRKAKAKWPSLFVNVPMALWNAARGRPVKRPGSP